MLNGKLWYVYSKQEIELVLELEEEEEKITTNELTIFFVSHDC